MATIVLHKPTGECFVLIGTGFGAYSSSSPSFFGGNLFPNKEYGEVECAAVSDAAGTIRWLPTEELQVLEVDGKSPEEWLQALRNKPYRLNSEGSADEPDEAESQEEETCPACGHRVRANARQCPSCELTLSMQDTD